MRIVAVVVCALFACGKGKAKEAPVSDPVPAMSGSAAVPAGDDPPAEPVEQGTGLNVKHASAEYSGTYAKVFGRFTNGTEPNSIVFVRGCAALTCDPGPWEAEQVARVCPKAYLATAKFAGDHAGRFQVQLELSGPAGHASTVTL